MNPSTDQVLTNVPMALGLRPRWVSSMFGDVDPSDAGLAHKFSPLRTSGGADVAEPDSVRNIEQGLL